MIVDKLLLRQFEAQKHKMGCLVELCDCEELMNELVAAMPLKEISCILESAVATEIQFNKL